MKRYANRIRARIPSGPKASVGRALSHGAPPSGPECSLVVMAATVAHALWRRERAMAAPSPPFEQLDRVLDRHFEHGGQADALRLNLQRAESRQRAWLETLFKDIAEDLLRRDPELCAAVPPFMVGHDGTLARDSAHRHEATLRLLKAVGATLLLDADANATGGDVRPSVTSSRGVILPFGWWSTTVALAVLRARWIHVTKRDTIAGGIAVL